MASIPKSNIANGNTLQAADIKNIIDALDGTTTYDITMKGTLNLTGSVITGSISNATSASYVVTSSYAASSSYAKIASSSAWDGNKYGDSRITGDNANAQGIALTISGSGGGKISLFTYGRIEQSISGTSNAFFGAGAGQETDYVANRQNTAVGHSAFYTCVSGYNNTAVGYLALAVATSSSNTAIGSKSGARISTGAENTSVGTETLGDTTTGHYNTAVGYQALSSSTSSSNSAFGHQAGYNLRNGWNNTMLGFNAQAASSNSSHSITLGNNQIAGLRCATQTITALSDRRDKKEITPLDLGIEFINELKPVNFTWHMRDGGKVDIPDMGFIAQDLQFIETKYKVKEHLKLVLEDNPEKLEASYGRLLPVMVKALQDLSQENKELKERLNKAGL